MGKKHTDVSSGGLQSFIIFLLRIAIAIALLSAVADRFGLWGQSGSTITWGSFPRFIDYTEKLNSFLPHEWIYAIAWGTTIAELVLGILLLIGVFTRFAAIFSGLILLVLAITTAMAFGIKSPLNHAMFTASLAAFLLYYVGPGFLALDNIR